MAVVRRKAGTGVEDDGETLSLASTKTTLRFAADAKGVEVNISRPVGSYAGMSRSKTHAVQLRGFQLGGRAVSCCAGGAACAPLARGTVGDFSAGFWTQPAEAAEMAVTAGALVVVRPLRRLLVWCVRLLRLTSMALFRSAPPRMRRRHCGWWWLDCSA